jgi:hypothetical protein
MKASTLVLLAVSFQMVVGIEVSYGARVKNMEANDSFDRAADKAEKAQAEAEAWKANATKAAATTDSEDLDECETALGGACFNQGVCKWKLKSCDNNNGVYATPVCACPDVSGGTCFWGSRCESKVDTCPSGTKSCQIVKHVPSGVDPTNRVCYTESEWPSRLCTADQPSDSTSPDDDEDDDDETVTCGAHSTKVGNWCMCNTGYIMNRLTQTERTTLNVPVWMSYVGARHDGTTNWGGHPDKYHVDNIADSAYECVVAELATCADIEGNGDAANPSSDNFDCGAGFSIRRDSTNNRGHHLEFLPIPCTQTPCLTNSDATQKAWCCSEDATAAAPVASGPVHLQGFGGCKDDQGTHHSGWLDTDKPYTPASCNAACAGLDIQYLYFTIADPGDQNCKCHSHCSLGTDGWKAYEMNGASTADAPVAGAKGDPHLQNIKGEHFEVMQTGNMLLIEVPRGSNPTLDFAVRADIDRLEVVECGPTFITRVYMTGRWLGAPLDIRSGAFEDRPATKHAFALRLDNGKWESHASFLKEEKEEKTLSLSKHATIMKQRRGFFIKVGVLNITVSQPRRPRVFLDVNIEGIGHLKTEVGGLLGLDDHSAAAEVTSECQTL